jgi:ankyrin repeat protein
MTDETPESAPEVENQLVDAARNGDIDALTTLLDQHPDMLRMRAEPYEWSLLHFAAQNGHLPAVDLLLKRGLDVNTREKGDNTYAMHWAAAAGHLAVVQRLADAGGDVVGRGDDHALEVIGWATCWRNYHAAVADFLVSRGARHNIFSAIAMNLAEEVRRIVASDPAALNSRLTRNENHQTPLHHAVLNNRPEMVSLLMTLGADPLAGDGSGVSPAVYATAPDTDRGLMEKIRDMTSAELDSAVRGHRPPRVSTIDVVAALALGDRETAARLMRGSPEGAEGVLHIMAKRGDVAAVKWLLDQGADPNARWAHWDAVVTPLHLAAAHGHANIVRMLLAAGTDPSIRDSKHDSDALGWADFFQQPEIVQILKDHAANT